MRCILIWSAIELYLYKCPIAVDLSHTNCTVVHTATYDAEFMTMCTSPIGLPETTTQMPMEIDTTLPPESSPALPSGTAPSPSPTHGPTTAQTNLSTLWSPSPSSQTDLSRKTTLAPSHAQWSTTTVRPMSNPSPTPSSVHDNDVFIPPSPSPRPLPLAGIQTASPPTSTNTLSMIAIVVSSVSIALMVMGSIVFYRKYALHQTRKVVRPSQVNLDPSEDPKNVETNTRKPLRDKAWHIVDMKRAVHSVPKGTVPSVPLREKRSTRGALPPRGALSQGKPTVRVKRAAPDPPSIEKPAAPTLGIHLPVVRRDTKVIGAVHQMAKKFDPNHQPKKTINDNG